MLKKLIKYYRNTKKANTVNILPFIVVASIVTGAATTAVTSFNDNFTLAVSDDFIFKLFNSISFCDNVGTFDFFGIKRGGGGGTFFSIENIALV